MPGQNKYNLTVKWTGKNGQILNVVPSKGLVVVRMGERPDDQFFISTIFNNDIWKYLNEIMANETSVTEEKTINFSVFPDLASDYIEINIGNVILSPDLSGRSNLIKIYNTYGECVKTLRANNYLLLQRIDISLLPVGFYFIQIGNYTQKFMVVR